MGRRKYVIGISLFVFSVLLLGVLATGWNYKILELAREIPRSTGTRLESLPWYWLILGTLGFCAVLVTTVILFTKLLQEIRFNQMQTEFLARVSHELKTPLATMELSSALLKTKNISDDEAATLWNSHDVELTRLRQDVEKLLMAARFDGKKLKVEKYKIDIEKWLSESVKRWQAQPGQIVPIKRLGDRLEFDIDADSELLNLIFDNLIDNARKFSSGIGAISVVTGIEREREKIKWVIEIADQGMGFESKYSKKIFKHFYRAPQPLDHKIKGTGLGLSIVASAARQMKMKVTARSEGPGCGSCFKVEGEVSL